MTAQIKSHCWTFVRLLALFALVALATPGSGGKVQAASAADSDNVITPTEWPHGGGDAFGRGRLLSKFQSEQKP